MVLFSCLHVPSNSQKKIIVFFLSIEKQQRRVCKWRHSKKRNNNWIIFKFRVWQLEELPFPLYIFYRSSGNPHVLWSWPLANLSSLPLPHRAASLMACTHMAARKTNQLSQSKLFLLLIAWCLPTNIYLTIYVNLLTYLSTYLHLSLFICPYISLYNHCRQRNRYQSLFSKFIWKCFGTVNSNEAKLINLGKRPH